MKNNSDFKYNSVLLIDDNDLDNFINQKMLETNHFSKNIHISTDGQMALDFLKEYFNSNKNKDMTYPEIIFVDINMPVMGGFEFIENFKRIKYENSAKCKIVILTSSINHEDKEKSTKIDTGIIFVNKPLTNEKLNSL